MIRHRAKNSKMGSSRLVKVAGIALVAILAAIMPYQVSALEECEGVGFLPRVMTMKEAKD